MMRMDKRVTPLLLATALAGCAEFRQSPVPNGARAYDMVPVQAQGIEQGAIQPGDRLYIRVLGEPDLTSDQYWVDGSGKLQLPLAGELQAGGRTISQVQQEITDRLGARYVRDPAVAVSIVQHAQNSVTVEGEVQKAGRFEAAPGLTLIGAMALAQSTTRDAKLGEVIVFRTVDNKRMAARFDLTDIRKGRAPDPQIIAGDTIVVGRSAIKGGWHEFLQAAPAFSIFYYLK